MFDTSSLNSYYRKFPPLEDMPSNCSLFRKVVARHGLPKLENLSFQKDPSNNGNVAVLPLLERADSVLNTKTCILYIVFPSDQLFNDKISRIVIVRELVSNNIKIEQPAPSKSKNS